MFFLILVALFSLIIIAILLLRTNKIRKSANNNLLLKNTEITQQKEEITTHRDEIINKTDRLDPDIILNLLRKNLIIALKQRDNELLINDGMDIALCYFDWKNKQVKFSGAYRPLIIIRNDEMIEIKGDKQPISAFIRENSFTNNVIELQKNDKLYMFTDGYSDQLGGKDTKKFMYVEFKKLLLNIHKNNMAEQKKILIDEHKNWLSHSQHKEISAHSQVDDILIIGLEFGEL